MTIDPMTGLTIAIPAIGALVWLIRLEGRLNLNERRTDDLHEDISEIKKDIKTLLRINGNQANIYRATD